MTDLSAWVLLPPWDAADAARADQDARWRAGNPLRVEAYLDALPAVAADPGLALVLIYGEVLFRTAAGEKPTFDEYAARFPHLADRLAIQFHLHSAFAKASTGDPNATNPIDQTRSQAGAVPAEADPLPTTFGPFMAREVIGRGGMGVVLSAHDPTLDREVAVKTLRPGIARGTVAARFHREARISAQVQHPGVPPVYAVGELSDGTPYLAMKLVRGRTLADLMTARPSPAADLTHFLDIVEQVAQAVGYAHAHGVIHRDLKPGNVMVGSFGEVQVMDWGLAKELGSTDFAVGTGEDDPPAGTPITDGTVADDRGLTRVGTMLGTPAYMAPEQARGEPTGPRADVFGLGAILCAVLTGQPPYAARDAMAAAKKALDWDTADAFRRLTTCPADPEVVDLCKRCLAKEPADRPADGKAVADELARLRATAADRLKRADLIALTALTRRQELRKRVWVSLGVAGVCAAAAVALAGWYVADASDREAQRVAAVRAEVLKEQREYEEKEKAAVARETTTRSAMEQEVITAVANVENALGRIRASADDPVRWEGNLRQAREELSRAEKLVVAVGRVWPAENRAMGVRESWLAPRVKAVADRVERAEKDRTLVVQLDEVAFDTLDHEVAEVRVEAVASRYASKFDRFAGVRPAEVDKFDELVRTHPVPDALIEAVFDWHWHAADADRKLLAPLLDRVTAHNPFLGDWWAAAKDPSPAGTAKLVKLTTGADRAKHSRWTVHRMFLDLWARGERNVSARVMRQGLQRFPTDYRLNARFALSLATLDTAAARVEARGRGVMAATVRPQALVVCLLLARLFADDPTAALPYLDRVLALDSYNLSARLDRAEVLTRLGDPAAAAADYAAVAKLAKPVQGRLTVISNQWAAGERTTAEAELQRLLPGMPKEAHTQYQLAELFQSMGRPLDAERAYRAAAAGTPSMPGFQLRLAQHLEWRSADLPEAKRRDLLLEAAEVLSRSADRFVTRHTPYWHLVFLHARLGDSEKAVAAGEKAAELGKGNADAEWVLGFAQLVAGKLDAATITALRFVQKRRADPRGGELLAQIAVAKSAAEWPAEVRELLHAGMADLYQKEYARAAAAFRRVVEQDGKLAAGHLNLGLARLGLQDWDGATEALTTAAKLDPALAAPVNGMLDRVDVGRKQTPREVLPPPRAAGSTK